MHNHRAKCGIFNVGIHTHTHRQEHSREMCVNMVFAAPELSQSEQFITFIYINIRRNSDNRDPNDAYGSATAQHCILINLFIRYY